MPVNVPDGFAICKLRFRAQGDTQEMISTIGAKVNTNSPNNSIAQQIGEAWLSAWAQNGLAPSWSFVGVQVAIGPQGSTEIGEWNTNAGGQGNFSPCPSNCALLISKLTDFAGKSNKGRMYIPAGYLSEAEVDQNGFLSGPALSGYQTNATAFWAAVEGANLASVDGWYLFHGGPGGVPSDAPTPITAFSVQTQIATQRQRMRR